LEEELNNREFQSKDILKRKQELVQSKALAVVRTYDTFEHESGKKDVSLCKNSRGEKFILRIGEVRTKQFFFKGYKGGSLIIPEILKQELMGVPYEFEEYLTGSLASEIAANSGEGEIEPELLEKLLSAFWEFQTIGKQAFLEQRFSIDKIVEHLHKAEGLSKNYAEVEKIIYQHRDFWNKGYPSKWKFALDNLIITENNKVGLIDNAKIGLRYFGYDLGWLIWPLWVTMKTGYYRKTDEYLRYLNDFSHRVAETAPKEYSKIDVKKYFWLMILERIIGMYFDVANNTKHLRHWSIGLNENHKRTKEYLSFLESILKHTLIKIS
jgi:hypothetical protein